MKDFLTLARERCSIRSYEKRKVEKEKRDLILEAGRLAPRDATARDRDSSSSRAKMGWRKYLKQATHTAHPWLSSSA